MPTFTEYFVHKLPGHGEEEDWSLSKSEAVASARALVRGGAEAALVTRARVNRTFGAAAHTNVVDREKLVFGAWRDGPSMRETTSDTVLRTMREMSWMTKPYR